MNATELIVSIGGAFAAVYVYRLLFEDAAPAMTEEEVRVLPAPDLKLPPGTPKVASWQDLAKLSREPLKVSDD